MASTTIHEQMRRPATNTEPKISTAAPASSRRPLVRRLLQLVRRTHLYVGLFLFPWAILYGLTGVLFNHPTFLADAPTVSFSKSAVIGTPLEHAPSPQQQAEAVLAALNEQKQPEKPFQMGTGPAHYATRESFIATVRADQRTFFVVYDPKTMSGTIRETTPAALAGEAAPFATGRSDAPRQRGMGMMGPMKHDSAGVKLADAMTDRLKQAIPVLMQRQGFPTGDVTVTTAPDVKFPVEADGRKWTATFSPLTTSVTGTPGDERPELSFRAFLLRMHLSRGYPGAVNLKWFWALGVDAIGLTLCFWGVSGLLMWWQIKSTRLAGLALLAVGVVASTALGFGMYGLLAA